MSHGTAASQADQLLMTGGVPSAKFATVGDVLEGTVVYPPEARQQRDYKTGEPATYADGNPMMMIAVTLQTEQRDPKIGDDDGMRMLYVRVPGQLRNAMRAAVKRSGASGLEVGGRLRVVFATEMPSENPKLDAQKIFEVSYARPDQGDTSDAAPF